MSDFFVEVRVYRFDPDTDLPLEIPPGIVSSEVVMFADGTNALTVADRCRRPLKIAVEAGIDRLPERVKPGRRAAGLHPLETEHAG